MKAKLTKLLERGSKWIPASIPVVLQRGNKGGQLQFELGGHYVRIKIKYELTRELPGVALVNISTWPIFMGKGNTLFREICITLPGRVRRIERHRLSGYQSLGLHKHLDKPQTKDSHIS